MGRNKFSEKEIKAVSRLLEMKNKANRAGQKEIRHELRTRFEFNISDFNVQGKAFGAADLQDAIKRKAIVILDDATIANMLAKRARDKAHDLAQQQEQTTNESPEGSDWQKALKEWNEWEEKQQIENKNRQNL